MQCLISCLYHPRWYPGHLLSLLSLFSHSPTRWTSWARTRASTPYSMRTSSPTCAASSSKCQATGNTKSSKRGSDVGGHRELGGHGPNHDDWEYHHLWLFHHHQVAATKEDRSLTFLIMKEWFYCNTYLKPWWKELDKTWTGRVSWKVWIFSSEQLTGTSQCLFNEQDEVLKAPMVWWLLNDCLIITWS